MSSLALPEFLWFYFRMRNYRDAEQLGQEIMELINERNSLQRTGSNSARVCMSKSLKILCFPLLVYYFVIICFIYAVDSVHNSKQITAIFKKYKRFKGWINAYLIIFSNVSFHLKCQSRHKAITYINIIVKSIFVIPWSTLSFTLWHIDVISVDGNIHKYGTLSIFLF